MFDIIEHVMAEYDRLTEMDIGQLEREALRDDPEGPARELLYALRVSKCVPTLTSLKTLTSRWGTACCSSSIHGLDCARGQTNHAEVHRFLSKLYAQRFDLLAAEIANKAFQRAAKSKNDSTKGKIIDKATETIWNAAIAFSDLSAGMEPITKIYVNALEVYRERIGNGDDDITPPGDIIYCDFCKGSIPPDWQRIVLGDGRVRCQECMPV